MNSETARHICIQRRKKEWARLDMDIFVESTFTQLIGFSTYGVAAMEW